MWLVSHTDQSDRLVIESGIIVKVYPPFHPKNPVCYGGMSRDRLRSEGENHERSRSVVNDVVCADFRLLHAGYVDEPRHDEPRDDAVLSCRKLWFAPHDESGDDESGHNESGHNESGGTRTSAVSVFP